MTALDWLINQSFNQSINRPLKPRTDRMGKAPGMCVMSFVCTRTPQGSKVVTIEKSTYDPDDDEP